MSKMLGPEVKLMATKTIAIRAIVMAMVGLMYSLMVELKPWMPLSSRGIQIIPLP